MRVSGFQAFAPKSIAQRLLIALALFLLPVTFVTGKLIHVQTEHIAFSQRELVGVHYLEPALVMHARMIDATVGLADNKPASTAARDAFEKLSAGHAAESLPLSVNAELKQVARAISKLEGMAEYDPVAVREILATSRELIRKIGENSNLLLDPELHTYYLMSTVVARTAPLLEYLAYHGSAVSAQANNGLANFKLVATRHEGRLLQLSSDYNIALDDAIRAERTPGAKRNPAHSADHTARVERKARQATAHLETSISNKDPLKADYLAFVARSSTLAASILAVDDLEDSLEARMAQLKLDRAITTATVTALFLMCLILVLVAVRHGVVTPLGRLTAAMRKVAGGELRLKAPYADRADELGDMARALDVFRDNAVARIEAEHAAKAKSEFLAVMSHEIRTPMNGVLGMAQALSATELADDQLAMLRVIEQSGDTLLALLNDILDMSKIEAGRIDLETIALDPDDIAQHVASLFEQPAAAKGLSFILETAQLNAWHLGDPTRIRQIVTNLVSNAIKFTQTGSVRLATGIDAAGAVTFTVADTGIGLDPERVDKLFAKFTQMDSSHTRIYGGTGLGLAITRALVEAMGGRIDVTSSPGVGSTFTLVLPLPPCAAPMPVVEDVTDTQPVHVARDDQADAQSGGLSVLVADDNETNRAVLKLLLAQVGIDAEFVIDGKEAFDAWSVRHYDLILMDMQMPVWDGMQAMREIRRAERIEGRPHTAIVALTANAMAHQITEQLTAGADAHAAKPIRLPELLSAIETALAAAEDRQHGLGAVAIGV